MTALTIDVRPRMDRVLCRPLTREEIVEDENRIVIEGKGVKRVTDMIRAEVLDIGPRVFDVAIGDKVLLPSKYMERPDASFLLVKEADIEGVILPA